MANFGKDYYIAEIIENGTIKFKSNWAIYSMNKVGRGIAQSQRPHWNVLCAVGTPNMPQCIRITIYRLELSRETGYKCTLHINQLLWVFCVIFHFSLEESDG